MATKVSVGVITEVLLAHLGVVAAVGGLLASLTVEEAVEQYIRRRNWRARRLWIVSLLLWLLDHAEKALAAVRRKPARRPGITRAVTATGPAVSAVTVTAAALLVVVAFTTADAVAGRSLVAHRRTTFFGGDSHSRSAVPLDGARLQLPAAVDVEAPGPRGALAVRSSSSSPGAIKDTTPPHIEAPPSVPAATTADATAIVDHTAIPTPTLRVPAQTSSEAEGPSGAHVDFSVGASDPVDGALAAVCKPASGSLFPLGRTMVACAVTNSHHRRATGSFSVTVVDTTRPKLELTAPSSVAATSRAGASVSYSVAATDLVSGSLEPSCAPLSGSVFPIGPTTVTCDVADAAGNPAAGSLVVVVVDEPPAFEPPATVNASAAGRSGARVRYQPPTAVDAVDGSIVGECDRASGSLFPLGSTTVNCVATDSTGHSASTTVTVVVVDSTPPVVTVPSKVLTAPFNTPFDYSGSVSAVDNVDGAVQASCKPPPGTVFASGVYTTVTCTATDRAGNVSKSATFRVWGDVPIR